MNTVKFIELKDCPYYFAGDDGNIYSKKGMGNKKDSYKNIHRRLISSKGSSGKGYLQINIKHKDSTNYKSVLVHRLIYSAFKGKLIKGLTISHKDGNKLNNLPSNLIQESYSDNHKRKLEHGTHDIGVNNSRALINDIQLQEIKELLNVGELTHNEIGKKFGVSRVFITKINTGKRYKI